MTGPARPAARATMAVMVIALGTVFALWQGTSPALTRQIETVPPKCGSCTARHLRLTALRAAQPPETL
jgi:hypothetical protein